MTNQNQPAVPPSGAGAAPAPAPASVPAPSLQAPAAAPAAPAAPVASPAESPAPAAPAAPAEPKPTVDFTKLDEELNLLDAEATSEVQPPAKAAPQSPEGEKAPEAGAKPPAATQPAKTPAEVKTPVAVPAAPVQPQKPAEAKPPEAAAAQPPAKAPETPAPEKTPEQIKAEGQQWRTDQLGRLEKLYALTEDQGVEMVRAPEKVVPQMLARMHLDIVETAVTAISNILPQMVVQELDRLRRDNAAEQAFYGRWPKLKEHSETVKRTMLAYRQLNPTLPADRLIQEVGAAVSVALGIPPDDVPLAPAQPPAQPFTPVQPGAGTGPVPEPKKLNEFEQLAVELVEEDRS